jgi:cytochrome c biogenesis protein CcmG, thiol:disulfide interchange protein DsbE
VRLAGSPRTDTHEGDHVPAPTRTRHRRRRAALGVLVAVMLVACSGGDEVGEASGPPAPDRTFETFDGEETSLPELEGTPVVVNFWASWCAPCVAEMPDFERVHQDLGDRVRFLGLNTQDDRVAADELVEQTGVTYDLALDPDGDLFRDFGVFAMPTTVFVDAHGHVAHRHSGLATEQQLRDLIREHLDP